jgi:hypothetical protein
LVKNAQGKQVSTSAGAKLWLRPSSSSSPPSGQHDNDLIIFKLRESKPQKAKPSKRPKAMEPSTPLAVETTTTTKNQREREREKKSALPTLSLTTATNLESAKRGR